MEEQKVKENDFLSENKEEQSNSKRQSDRKKLKPHFRWKMGNEKEEDDYEIKGEAEYITAGATIHKKRKSEKRTQTMQLKHEQREKEEHAREEFFAMVSKVAVEQVNEENMIQTLKQIEQNNTIEENVIRLQHILKNKEFCNKVADKTDEIIIVNLFNLMLTPLINKIALRCLWLLAATQNKVVCQLLFDKQVFFQIQTLLSNEVFQTYNDEIIDILYQLLMVKENSYFEKLSSEILNSNITLKQLCLFAYSTINKIMCLQDKSEELAKRKKKGRKPKRGPKSTKKVGEQIQGEGLEELVKVIDPNTVKAHSMWVLEAIEPNGLINNKYALKLSMAITSQYQNLIKMNVGDTIEIQACQLFSRSLQAVLSKLESGNKEEIDTIFENTNFIIAMIEILKVKEWAFKIQSELVPQCIQIIKQFIEINVNDAIQVQNLFLNFSGFQQRQQKLVFKSVEINILAYQGIGSQLIVKLFQTSQQNEQMLIDILDISLKVSKSIESHYEIILLQWENFTHFESQKSLMEEEQIEEVKPTIYQLIDCHIPRVIEQILILIKNALMVTPFWIQLVTVLNKLPDVLLEKLQMYVNSPKYYNLILESLIKLICDWSIQLTKPEIVQKKHNLRQLLERLMHFKQAHLYKFCKIYDSLSASNFKSPLQITYHIQQQFKESF